MLTVGGSAGAVTGGARVARDTHVSLTISSDGAAVNGQLEFHAGRSAVHVRHFSSLGIAGAAAWIAGTTDEGDALLVYIEDRGEPGDADVLRIWIGGVLRGGGTLIGGDLQLRAR